MNQLIKNNFFIAICAGIATIGTFLLFVPTVEASYVFAIIFGTKFLYTLLRKGKQLQQKEEQKKILTREGVFALISAAFFLLALPTYQQWFNVFISIVLVFFYGAYLIFPKLETYSLRKNGWLKLICIGLVWSILTAIVPFEAMNHGMISKNYLYAFIQFLFIIALTIPFEIFDTDKLNDNNFHTVPDKIGIDLSKKLARGLIFSCWVLSGFVSLPVFYSMIICTILYLKWLNQDIQKQSLSQITLRFDGLILLQNLLMIGFHLVMT